MKKAIKWGVLALVLVIVAAVVGTYLYLDSIVKYAVETQGSKQMNLKTELDGASVGLLRGKVGLDDLKIANPPGFTAPHLFTLDGLHVNAPIGQLRGNPKRIATITLDKPKLVIERSADGKFNFRQAIEQMPKGPTGPSEPRAPQEPKPAEEEMKLIIDDLTIKDATVVIRPGLDIPGLAKELTVTVPTVSMKNIGNAEGTQNGAAMRDVAQQVITVLAANASNSNMLPEQLRGLLSLDVNQVMAEVSSRLGAEASKRIAGAVPGELGAQLSKIAADPNALLKNPNQAVDVLKENLGKELGKKLPTSNPSELLNDPAKAAEGLKGLLGGAKDKKKKDKSAE
jgi:uncharacterized protein involved in outer membrane biogenesis